MNPIDFDTQVEFTWKQGALECIVSMTELHGFLVFVLWAHRPVHEVVDLIASKIFPPIYLFVLCYLATLFIASYHSVIYFIS